jgi:hypothetical protein
MMGLLDRSSATGCQKGCRAGTFLNSLADASFEGLFPGARGTQGSGSLMLNFAVIHDLMID